MEQCPNCQREVTPDSKRLGYCEFCGFPIADKPTPPFPLSLQRALKSEEQEKAPDAAPTLLPTARKKKRLTDLGSQLMRLSPGRQNSNKQQPATDAATEESAEPLDDETMVEEPASTGDDAAIEATQASSSAELAAPDEQAFHEDGMTIPTEESVDPHLMSAANTSAPAAPLSPPVLLVPNFVAPVSSTPAASAPVSAPSAPFQAASPYPLPPAPPLWRTPPASYATPGSPGTNVPMTETSQPILPVQSESGQSRSGEYNPMLTPPSLPIYSGPGIVQDFPQLDAYMRYPTPNVTVFLPAEALPQSSPKPPRAKVRRTGRGFFTGCLTAIIVIAATGAGAVIWGLKNGYSIPAIMAPTIATQSLGTTVTTVPVGFTLFVAPDNDYSLIYPENWQQSSEVATGDSATTQTFISPDVTYEVTLSEQSSLLGSGEYPAFFATYLQPFALTNLQMAPATQPVVIGANQWLMLNATGTYHDTAYTLKLYGVNHDNHTIIVVTMTPTAAETIADGQFFQPMLLSLQLIG